MAGNNEKPDSKPEQFSMYTVFPTAFFFRHDITESQKMLYGLLSCMADSRGYAFPRNATLQKYLGGVSEDTVSRRLKALEAAGAIRIDGGDGGRGIRKIFVTGVDFSNLRKNAEVADDNLRKNAEVHNIDNNNKKHKKPAATEEEINQWIAAWAARLEYSRELVTPLISDFFGFADSRKAKGKPFLTIRAVAMQANRLLKSVPPGTDQVEQVARMRFMLRRAISRNWEEVYAIDDRAESEFRAWASQEYGICRSREESPDYF